MDAILNLGNPLKDIHELSCAVLSNPVQRSLKLTGARVAISGSLLLTSPLYGAGMVQDSLVDLWEDGLVQTDSRLILVGSMGSLSDSISLGTIVIPNPVLCGDYGYQGRELHQDYSLMTSLVTRLQQAGHEARVYRHGSSYAVYDYRMDHKVYRSALYDQTVCGLDCGEVFIGLEFAKKRGCRAAAVLFCSDSPKYHIADIGSEEFAKRAAQFDLALNRIAADALRDY